MEGTSYPLADMGMELTLTIGADGAAEMNMNGEGESIQCSMQDGVLTADGVALRAAGRHARRFRGRHDHDAEPREARSVGCAHTGR